MHSRSKNSSARLQIMQQREKEIPKEIDQSRAGTRGTIFSSRRFTVI
jgi:hypothetical protein